MFNSGLSRSEAASQRPEWTILEKVATASMVEQRRARRWGIFFKLLTFFYLFVLLAAVLPFERGLVAPAGGPHVGLVALDGVIAADSEANANAVVAGLRAAFEAESSAAVILAINSPGGSPVQSGYINDEIKRLRDLYPEKKLYAVISDLGASGAYYVAAAADLIYADKASLVGSIGVVSDGFGFHGLMEKLGIDRRVYAAGENKAMLDAFAPENVDDKAFWQEVLAVTHAQFIAAVKAGRGDRLLADEEIFSGLIWTGEQALAKGLVDGLGSAGHVARSVIGLEQVVDYSLQPSPLEEFSRRLGSQLSAALIEVSLPQLH